MQDSAHAALERCAALAQAGGDGLLAEPFPDLLPAGEVEASVEGPQGDEVWKVRGDGSDRPAAVTITTASQRVLAAVPLALQGQRLRAALLILASFDLCVACVDK
jgi:NADH:ubiquinone oxidoreductase subunit D